MNGIPIDEKTYIVEVTDDALLPEIPKGTFCIFRSEERSWTDGSLVLVAKPPLEEPISYAIRRYRAGNEDGDSCQPTDDALGEGKINPHFVEECSDQDCIVGEYICALA